jgi:hypothetical protein
MRIIHACSIYPPTPGLAPEMPPRTAHGAWRMEWESMSMLPGQCCCHHLCVRTSAEHGMAASDTLTVQFNIGAGSVRLLTPEHVVAVGPPPKTPSTLSNSK